MALDFEIIPYELEFKFEAKTSRGTLRTHKTWFIKAWDSSNPAIAGYGESAPFEGLSIDDVPDFEIRLRSALSKLEGAPVPDSLEQIEKYLTHIEDELPAVRFGAEVALRDLFYGGTQKIFDSNFYNDHATIDINGLVWMGDKELMIQRLELKVLAGYDCVKLKIGALNLEDELDIIHNARNMIGNDDLVIRVDANGAYAAEEVIGVLDSLAEYHVHSIEQPIKAGQIEAMTEICAKSPVPIALDEELIGVFGIAKKRELLATIKPQFIVLKPTLLGGFKATAEWIRLATELNIGWWVTSALESNIGLNAICQFASQYQTTLPQGLGTGELYENNIPSPLSISNGCVFLDAHKNWYVNLTERQI
jgi:O-succinylbenzoate synthase